MTKNNLRKIKRLQEKLRLVERKMDLLRKSADGILDFVVKTDMKNTKKDISNLFNVYCTIFVKTTRKKSKNNEDERGYITSKVFSVEQTRCRTKECANAKFEKKEGIETEVFDNFILETETSKVYDTVPKKNYDKMQELFRKRRYLNGTTRGIQKDVYMDNIFSGVGNDDDVDFIPDKTDVVTIDKFEEYEPEINDINFNNYDRFNNTDKYSDNDDEEYI